jgi:hypothetical protein
MVLMAVGILDVGTAMLQSMSLAFVAQGAAKAESQSPGTGVAGGELPAPGGVVHREHSSLRRTESRTAAVQTVIVPVGSVSAVACWPLNSKPS